ncbi:MAG TPA: PEGA domain-containing protein [Methanospirillum sp.]|nr:PEGA domain-containing protein [Methanospirillum sp.]
MVSFKTPGQILNASVRYLICISLIIALCSLCSADKTNTTLSISTIPEAPATGEPYTVTGTLQTAGGDTLGNKRVVCEVSGKGPGAPESFRFIGLDDTDNMGVFEFYRPENTPAEFVRVRYTGNSQYAATESEAIAVRGVQEDASPLLSGQTGSLLIRTNPDGADIYLDGTYRGITPATIGGLLEGAHALDLVMEGYENETMDAYVSPSSTTSVQLTMGTFGSDLEVAGLTTSISYAKNASELRGNPVMTVSEGGVSVSVYSNSTNQSEGPQVTTHYSDDLIGKGHSVMVIITDPKGKKEFFDK